MDKGQPMTHQLNWGEDADYMKFYVYPNIGYSQGNLEWNNNQQSIEFKSKKMAEYFSKNGLIKHYQQGGSTKQNPPKMWLQNDVDINYWNNMKKKYPTMIGIDPNHVDKYNNHLPIFANINTFVHPKTNLKRLKMVAPTLINPKIIPHGELIPVPQMQLKQQGNIPFYGPGNTIIGYTDDNRQFYPAQQYTGAPNNASNLQDKYLLENPDALRQYVSKLDNYRFDKGGVYSQALNNTVNGLNQLSYFSKNSPDNAMRDYYMNMSNYDSNNQDLYSTNQDLYGNTYFDEGGSYEELSNEYNDLSELQSIASMDGDNELYEYLAPQISSVQKSLTSLEELAKYDVIKEELQRQILQQPQFQEPSIEGYNPRRPFTSNYESTDSEPMMLGTKIYPNMKLKGSPRNVKAYLTQKGLSRNAIAGIMGNIEHESSFNPGIGGDQGTSFGLFQHHAKRKDNLLSYLKKRNLDKTSIEGQIDFALSEYPQLIQKLNKAVSPQQAADIWVREFEKPANVDKQSKLRQRAALKYMKQGGTLPFLKQYK
jgi:hypothetical protein